MIGKVIDECSEKMSCPMQPWLQHQHDADCYENPRKSIMKTYLFFAALVTCSLAANAQQPPVDHASMPVSADSVGGHGAAENVMGMLPPPVPPLTQEGKVLNTINTPNYTYVEVKLGDKTQWIAVQKLAVEKGNTILFDDGAPMSDFYSKTLDRVFPSVIFVSNAGVCHTKEP